MILLCFIFCFSFPVFAEDERYVFQDIRNEALYLQGYDLNEVYYINQIDFYHPSYSNDNNEIALRYFIDFDNSLKIKNVIVNRTTSGGSIGNISLLKYMGINNNDLYDNYIGKYTNTASTRLPYTLNYIDVILDDNSDMHIPVNLTVTDDLFNNGKYIYNFIGGKMTEYLAQVATVFTWILTHITELITFILGNPFLAVSLVLFMCGAVISFYIRIKNS